MSEYCIELNNVTKKFGKFTAVDNFSLQLEPGKIYGIIGPNGAGKSTTMSMIMGILNPTSGNGKIFDYPIGSKESLQYVGYSPEFTSFYSDMSCIEYLWYMGTVSGLSKKEATERAIELIKEFNLSEHANRKVSKFSTGMKKKVSLAQAMLHNPKIILLDEPTANLDPTSRMEILDMVRKMVNENNITVMISSHVLTELETIIDHVIMINHGKLIMDAPIDEAQTKFSHGILIVDTDNNEKVIEEVNKKYQYMVDEAYKYTIENDGIHFEVDNNAVLKKEIVKILYNNDIQLNKLDVETISLDSLYKKALEKGEE